jgi:hypothetical protein
MEPAMNEARVVRFVEISGQRLEARDQILERSGAKVAERGFK